MLFADWKSTGSLYVKLIHRKDNRDQGNIKYTVD